MSDYVAVSDSLGAIEIEVPTSWNVVDGSSYASEGGVTYASIRVAPSLNDFMSGWDTPGVIFRVTADEGEAGGPVQVLDDSRSSESLTLCNLDDRYEYNDSRYKGFYDHYTDCGGPGGSHYLILAAEPVQGPGNELVYVELQVVSDADLTTGDHILKTFHLVGALP